MQPISRLISVVIEKYAPPGNGLGFYQDKAVFVPQTAVGDEVLIRVEKEKKRYLLGSLAEIIKPGPDRRQEPCPHYAECGGCDLLHLPYSAQLALKKEMLNQVLTGVGITTSVKMVAAPNEFAYRHRAHFRRDPQSGNFGFLRRRSHQVATIPACLILAPALANMLENLSRAKGLSSAITACYGLAGSGGACAAAAENGHRLVAIPGYAESVMENYGFGELELAASGFAQANPAVTRLMLQDLSNVCRKEGTAAELYGGSGTFSLALANLVKDLTVYESDPKAAARGQRNVARNGLKNVKFVSGRVENKSLPANLDILLVDPPRTGLDAQVVEKIVHSRASKLIYVSCNPATLARDLGRLNNFADGFILKSLAAYDMYAGTTHLEVMALLERRKLLS
ncbi:MAG: class I SAM-dependent RNA methyltransferase [Deltaproteobacteria bacterium]|nr:class I SAM-dependent RNA methyltransferase [Deltaproteobacteria bacterium]